MAHPPGGYRLADGTKVPSVTTVLGRFKEGGGLMQWAYKTGREHGALDERGHFYGQVQEAPTLTAKLFPQGQPKPAPRHLYDVTALHAAAGTMAHDMIESDILGKPYAFPEQQQSEDGEWAIARAKNAFEQYKAWKAQTRLEIIGTELGQVSEKHRFAGTLDAVGRDQDGKVVLLDWKTSNGIYGEYLYQLAGYALLLEENKPEWTPRGFHILRVAKENADFAHHSYSELDREKEAFALMVRLYEIDLRTKKR